MSRILTRKRVLHSAVATVEARGKSIEATPFRTIVARAM